MSLAVSIRHGFGAFDIDATFESEGGVTALFGRSGAGKTTIVNTIGGLIRPRHGQVSMGGIVLVDTERGIFVPPHQRRVGYVFQDGRLFPHLSVRQNLLFGRWFSRKRGGREDFDHVVELLGVGDLLERRPGRLSGGEKQRVAIGRALLADPGALLMDEPLASLDEARKAEILPYIERLRDDIRIPIIYVSHSIPEVARLATTVVVLSEGKVERVGSPAEIMADPTLFPVLGRHEAGAVLPAVIAGHDPVDGLTYLDVQGGRLIVPRVDAPPGVHLRVHIRARDVILALKPPEGISALNILPATVARIGATDAPIVDLQLACGTDLILARITRRSLHALNVVPGQQIFAVLKSIAVGRRDIGIYDENSSAMRG